MAAGPHLHQQPLVVCEPGGGRQRLLVRHLQCRHPVRPPQAGGGGEEWHLYSTNSGMTLFMARLVAQVSTVSSVTLRPSCRLLARPAAPSGSTARRRVCSHPAWRSAPLASPSTSPPPPDAATRQEGARPRAAATSLTRLEWPSHVSSCLRLEGGATYLSVWMHQERSSVHFRLVLCHDMRLIPVGPHPLHLGPQFLQLVQHEAWAGGAVAGYQGCCGARTAAAAGAAPCLPRQWPSLPWRWRGPPAFPPLLLRKLLASLRCIVSPMPRISKLGEVEEPGLPPAAGLQVVQLEVDLLAGGGGEDLGQDRRLDERRVLVQGVQ